MYTEPRSRKLRLGGYSRDPSSFANSVARESGRRQARNPAWAFQGFRLTHVHGSLHDA